jgi:hypothetical protein
MVEENYLLGDRLPTVTVVKGTAMGWMNIARSSGKAEWADPRDESIANGAPYYPHQATANSAAAFGSCVEIPEEIKRRQRALLVNYVIALRAR